MGETGEEELTQVVRVRCRPQDQGSMSGQSAEDVPSLAGDRESRETTYVVKFQNTRPKEKSKNLPKKKTQCFPQRWSDAPQAQPGGQDNSVILTASA